jgi:hypothetical protein
VRHRKRKRERGMCGGLGCHNASGEAYYCDVCKASERVKLSDWRAKSKEPGYVVRGR